MIAYTPWHTDLGSECSESTRYYWIASRQLRRYLRSVRPTDACTYCPTVGGWGWYTLRLTREAAP